MSDTPLALTLPLHGTRLIEASAGTGKTYTLAALYIRLVLQHGDGDAFERSLMPPQILVVTFTEAATRELRDRIRARLAQAARCFRGSEQPPGHDRFLTLLLADYPDEAQRQHCADRLDAAAQWMDEAAVFTIHSFCNRMLRQHAFDSGSLFNLELSQDEDLLLEQATQDYWRTFVYSLDSTNAPLFHALAKTPASLQSQVAGMLDDYPHTAGLSLASLLGDLIASRRAALEQLKALWPEWLDALESLLNAAWDSKALKKSPRPADVANWFGKLRQWAKDPDATRTGVEGSKFFERITADHLASQVVKADATTDALLAHPALAAVDTLATIESQLPDASETLLPHAAHWINHRLQQHKRQRGIMGFDDMLVRLHRALTGDNGERLAAVIRHQFPLALIDEFQDTDPVQYEIFRTIYDQRPGTGWFMIGDPKQAIYGFRGADIFTYLQARQAATQAYTLDTNFRSSAALVNGVNQVFARTEKRESAGAFLLDRAIPFSTVSANGLDEVFEVNGEAQPALTFWQLAGDDGGSLNKGDYLSGMAEACATEMTRLLNLGQQGKARLHAARADDDGTVKPAHLAVLVRNGHEAEQIRTALARRGVRSVYLSDRDNVLDTAEATDLLLWLQACAEPESDTALRAALGSATLDLPWQTLDELTRDEQRWESRVEQFRGYRQRWQRLGVLPMLRTLLRDYRVPARLLRSEGGERALTNLLHLAELLQQAAAHLDGEQALIRWLQEERDNAGRGGSDEQIMRLESDAELVKVITIHKSKGLEYPLVFLPFICTFRQVKADDRPVRYHHEGKLRYSLAPDDAILQQADEERLAEDMRLLYVAMTRARHACWLGMAPLRVGRGSHVDLHLSGAGHLLGWQAGEDAAQLSARLEALAGKTPGIAIAPAPAPDTRYFNDVLPPLPADSGDSFSGVPAEHWWIASYSALEHGEGSTALPGSNREETLLEEQAEQHTGGSANTTGPHAFVRGPQAGTFLHGLLETLALTDFRDSFASDGPFAKRLAPRLVARRWQQWQPLLLDWCRQLVETPLPLGRTEVALNRLKPGHHVAEMEFMLPVSQVAVTRLDALIRNHVLPGQPRPALAAEQLNGMLKGFIDLVFEHDGRHYVLDYKSNWLGPDHSAYDSGTLRQAILQKRYDVQYCFYLLALHRLLKSRLGDDYDYQQHMGGAAYYFLRGVQHADAGIFFHRPEEQLLDELDALFRHVPQVEARA